MQKNYSDMTRDELRQVAKEMNIPGRGSMTKAQLLNTIIEFAYAVHEKEKNDTDNVVKVNVSVNANSNIPISQAKLSYLNTIKPGTIVAFRVMVNGRERVKSAAVANVSYKRQMLKLVTKYNAEYIIPFSSVVWVKVGERWPRYIYNLLKGIKNEK